MLPRRLYENFTNFKKIVVEDTVLEEIENEREKEREREKGGEGEGEGGEGEGVDEKVKKRERRKRRYVRTLCGLLWMVRMREEKGEGKGKGKEACFMLFLVLKFLKSVAERSGVNQMTSDNLGRLLLFLFLFIFFFYFYFSVLFYLSAIFIPKKQPVCSPQESLGEKKY